MLAYFVKRFFYALPVLWLIVTLIFMLSRLLPGSYASESILHAPSESYFATGDQEAKKLAYHDYLVRTGQHLPLFYFSLTASTEPDTLYKVYPEAERQHLQHLAWHYGNWPLAAAYYKQAKLAAQQLSSEQPAARPALENLLKAVDEKSVRTALTQLHTLAPQSASLPALKRSAQALFAGRNRYSYLLPALHWHGAQNQYHTWLAGLSKGDAGSSFRDGRPVQELIREALVNTWVIVLISLLLSAVLALELSILFLQRRFRKLKQLVMPLLFSLDSIPLFVLCLLLLILFANPDFLQLFPAYGMGYFQSQPYTWHEQLTAMLPFMVLPILSLSLAYLPYLTTQFYRALADAEATEFVRTARAKGLSQQQVIRRHVLRNALLPMITLFSDFLPALVAGAVITETIFAIPGMGSLLVSSVQARDYPVIVGIVLVVALVKFLSHLVADAGYMLADPRVRFRK